MVGLYAEPLPKGFGFSDTAFRVFILMASRRLKSDRFFTRDYNAETYTQAGLDWIDETTMIDVLKRHYPELEPRCAGSTTPSRRGREREGPRRVESVRELAAFLAIAIVVIVTPGQDTALTIRNTLLGGRAAGVATAAGIVVRHRVLDARGERRPRGVARRLGAGLRRAEARRRRLPRLPRAAGAAPCDPSGRPAVDGAAGSPLGPPRAFRQGLLSNLGNPKIAVFFTSLLPQFGELLLEPARARAAVLLARARLAVRLRARRRPRRRPAAATRIRRSLDALTGTILVAFGIRLAADR